jgi:lipopolysaccharide transport system ATP-binding protein
MRRADIRRRFDEIVAFAEVERFLDTPVKHYSSGMYMRLAFSVAAHLEPDVLVVDEVLAVGDMTFQKKCLGLMSQVSQQGRTVLFVSHNIPSLLNLCTRGALLEGGRLVMAGDIRSVADRYLSISTTLSGEIDLTDLQRPRFGGELTVRKVRVLGRSGQPTPHVSLTEGFDLEVEYDVRQPIRSCQVGFTLWNRDGHCVFQTTDQDEDPSLFETTRPPGRYTVRCRVPPAFLRQGPYSIDVAASVPGVRMLDEVRQAISFDVIDTGSIESRLAQGRLGVIAPILSWRTEAIRDIDAHPILLGRDTGR